MFNVAPCLCVSQITVKAWVCDAAVPSSAAGPGPASFRGSCSGSIGEMGSADRPFRKRGESDVM